MNHSMKINEDHLNEREKIHLDRAYCSQGVSQHPLHLAETQSRQRNGKRFAVEQREGFTYRDCWHGEAGSKLTRNKTAVWWARGTY